MPRAKQQSKAAVKPKRKAGRPKAEIDWAYVGIYGIRDANSQQYFYVGSTKHAPERRLSQHLHLYSQGKHTPGFAYCLDVIGVENLEIDLLDVVGDDRREACEFEWIERLLEQNHPLVNRVRSLKQQDRIRRIFYKPAGEKAFQDIRRIEAMATEEKANGWPLYAMRMYAAWSIAQSKDLGLFRDDVLRCFYNIREMFRENRAGVRCG